MKRTATKPGEIRWRKTGGGFLYIKIGGSTRMIKPNQIFDAKESEIPESFRDTIVPVDSSVKAKLDKERESPKPKTPVTKLKYEIVTRAGGYYNVVDQNGKKQNEKALRKEKAELLLESLQG